MRLLFVSSSYWPAFKFGGTIFAAHYLSKELVKKGIDVTVYTTVAGLEGIVEADKEATLDGVKITYFNFVKIFESLGPTGWQFSPAMSAKIKCSVKDFDLVYIMGIWNFPIACAAYHAKKNDVPYIVCPSGAIYPYIFHKKIWKKWIYYQLVIKKVLSFASAIHYTARDEADKSVFQGKTSIEIVPCALDLHTEKGHSGTRALQDGYVRLEDKKIILFLSRIHPKKGLDILVEAYSRLLEKRDDLHLIIAGGDDENYGIRIKQILQKKGISYADKGTSRLITDEAADVTFCGMLTGDEKQQVLNMSDIFVLPSYSENFGIAVAEAMAAGLPVIISDQVGIHNEISASGSGIVIGADAQELEKAIESLLNNPALAEEIGEKGASAVARLFDRGIISDRMIEVFNRAISDHKNKKGRDG